MQKKHWRPKHGQEYFYIDESGVIGSHSYCLRYFDEILQVNFGNCFQTREAANKVLSKIKSNEKQRENPSKW